MIKLDIGQAFQLSPLEETVKDGKYPGVRNSVVLHHQHVSSLVLLGHRPQTEHVVFRLLLPDINVVAGQI